MNSIPRIPTPVNEPVLSYAPATPERAELKRTLKELSGRQLEIPLVIGGKDVHTGRTVDVVMPHCHRHVLAKAHQAGPAELQAAIAAARCPNPPADQSRQAARAAAMAACSSPGPARCAVASTSRRQRGLTTSTVLPVPPCMTSVGRS